MPYLYAHFREDSGRIFYIGIGTQDDNYRRAYTNKSRNKIWRKIVEKNGFFVRILKDELSIDEAKKLEVALIKHFGRIDNRTGVLSNMTDGGDGVIGFVATDEYRQKISMVWKGKKRPLQTRIKMRKPKSKEHAENAAMPKRKLILNVENGIYYLGCKEAANSLGLKRRTLAAMLSGQNRNWTNFKIV